MTNNYIHISVIITVIQDVIFPRNIYLNYADIIQFKCKLCNNEIIELMTIPINFLKVISKFEEFMAVHYLDGRQCYTLEPSVLNNYICNYLLQARRQDGSDYEPDTLTSIHRALDR